MKSNHSVNLSVGIVSTLVVLAAGAAAAQSNPPPCTLLTQAQVSAALGASAGAGQPIGTTGCAWDASHIKATLSLWDATNWDRMKGPLPGVTKTAVAGLGDDAYFATPGTSKPLITLTVKKGKTALIFHIYGVDKITDQMSMEKTLAGSALAKW